MAKIDYDALSKKYESLDTRDLYNTGYKYLNSGHVDSALAVFTLIVNRYEANGRPENRDYVIQSYNALGVICFLRSNHTGAYSYFTSANELDTCAYSPGYLNISAIYLYYGDKEKAYALMRRVFDAAMDNGKFYIASCTLFDMLGLEMDSSVLPPDTTRLLIDSYLRNVQQTPDNVAFELVDHIAKARLYNLDGRYAEAIGELRLAIPATQKMLIPSRDLFACMEELGSTFAKAGQTDSALFYFNRAIEIATQYQYLELLISAYGHLSDLYADMGNRRMAEEYRYRKLNLNDSVFTASEFGKIHNMELFYQTSKFEKRITRIMLEKQMQKRMLVVELVALLLVLGLALFVIKQNRILKRKNHILFERNLAEMKTMEIKAGSEPCRPMEDTETPLEEEAASSLPMTEDKMREIEDNIRLVMSHEEIFCREGFSLRDLAKHCGSNTKYVSQILNERMGRSFSQYLNECRVSVARKRFVDFEHYGNLTIEAIISELGFKSRSTFSKTFKRITGLSPSEFQRLARENRASAL
ncbi:MAG: AraC family transcriptional regulator [Bacteroidales bacterium]|nr:AraC family transcriptional regulator [Bacteroidales bacterium]